MDQTELKRQAALAALAYVPAGAVIGVGSGSTVNLFIDALATLKPGIAGAVPASEASAARLRHHAITVVDLNNVQSLAVCVDGADEIDGRLCMIKGGGAALTREKIVAAVSEKFVCICDATKRVDVLGKFPLPVEVIPMAREHVSRELVKLGGRPVLRAGITTDNGNIILDVHGLAITQPEALESTINQIAGVVTNGLFAQRSADVLLLASADGVKTFTK